MTDSPNLASAWRSQLMGPASEGKEAHPLHHLPAQVRLRAPVGHHQDGLGWADRETNGAANTGVQVHLMLQVLIRNAVHRAVTTARATLHARGFINAELHTDLMRLARPHGAVAAAVEHVFEHALG